MTDEQFNRLKTLLNASSQQTATPELDKKILQQARLATELQKTEKQQPEAPNDKVWANLSWPIGNTAIAFSALFCTAAILFGLAQVTSVSEPDFALKNTIDETEHSADVAQIEKPKLAPRPSFITPSKQPTSHLTPSIFDQKILAEIELPSAQQMVDRIHFTIAQDRQRAEQVIGQAMTDINQLLNAGNLATARQRYQQLRKGCTPCALPQTLEALARINTKQMDSG